jgi:hypothetical protein
MSREGAAGEQAGAQKSEAAPRDPRLEYRNMHNTESPRQSVLHSLDTSAIAQAKRNGSHISKLPPSCPDHHRLGKGAKTPPGERRTSHPTIQCAREFEFEGFACEPSPSMKSGELVEGRDRFSQVQPVGGSGSFEEGNPRWAR